MTKKESYIDELANITATQKLTLNMLQQAVACDDICELCEKMMDYHKQAWLFWRLLRGEVSDVSDE